MNLHPLNQFLILYGWFPLAILLLFLLFIARFYEKFSGERTHFRLFILPILLFAAAAVRYAGLRQVFDNTLGDLLTALGGSILLILCLSLYRRMILRQRK